MQIRLSPDQPRQVGGALPEPVDPGEVIDLPRDVALSLIEQVDKWQPVGQVKAATIDEVLAGVADDPARAAQALESERAGKNRSSLITKLEAITSSDDSAQAQDED